jgi:hypothetical protein
MMMGIRDFDFTLSSCNQDQVVLECCSRNVGLWNPSRQANYASNSPSISQGYQGVTGTAGATPDPALNSPSLSPFTVTEY